MHRPPRTQRRRGGFTLLEILLVLAILVILGGLVVYNFSGIQQNAYGDIAKRQIATFKSMLEMYKLDTGRYPTTQTGLQALRTMPSDLPNPKKWKGPYIKEDIPADPWDNPYRYESSTPTQFRIWSMGPDMVEGTGDDITS